ncbi:hypothetical protein H2203_006174 [Taxawa tesnikishii (nom. ined.)]|nr:hypothetical protein H2203_006174 [Dothideales sp. JES 119]
MVAFKTFAESCKTIWFKMITCCDDQEEEPERKLVIVGERSMIRKARLLTQQQGEPYNFRREDISIAGLSASEQSALQARAVADADRMLRTLQPLTSPSNSPTRRRTWQAAASAPRAPRSRPFLPFSDHDAAGPRPPARPQPQRRLQECRFGVQQPVAGRRRARRDRDAQTEGGEPWPG